MLVKFLLLVIKFYQKAISPLVPARCRFYPTCSVYGIHTLKWHGVRGIPLVIRRIFRCQPWGVVRGWILCRCLWPVIVTCIVMIPPLSDLPIWVFIKTAQVIWRLEIR
ncbi:membrane protein insertion efficiency factor YidD [Moraxella bovis]|uniref:membrane protein insertion efficiency factor YidD n=1 Tax=Moraxella bovis TaxID=476 RepID=UPI0022276129|nr:membrane protein insertion efficiency factor YidD [Moraxella bovis]UYZ81178.1 membrane protein insertion efficiency factor YidD [Moraxella bovis]